MPRNAQTVFDTPYTPIRALTTGFDLPLADGNAPNPATGAPNATAMATRAEQRHGLRIGKLRLMIRYEDGSELAELPRVHRLPGAPRWFHGMTNLHGTLIPVFSLAGYLGLEERAGPADSGRSQRTMLLTIGSGTGAVGVLIDGLPQRLLFHGDRQIEDIPVPAQLEGHVAGTYWIDRQAWMDFMPAGFFDRIEAELASAS